MHFPVDDDAPLKSSLTGVHDISLDGGGHLVGRLK
jgi:hypothetical protein